MKRNHTPNKLSVRAYASDYTLYDPIHNDVVTIQAACRLHAEQILANRLGHEWVRLKGSRPKFITVSTTLYKAVYDRQFDYNSEDF